MRCVLTSVSLSSYAVHDPALDRTTDGVGRIAHTDYYGGLDKLRTKEFPQQPIATFHEAMQLISRPENQHVTFNVDIKPEKWVMPCPSVARCMMLMGCLLSQ